MLFDYFCSFQEVGEKKKKSISAAIPDSRLGGELLEAEFVQRGCAFSIPGGFQGLTQ